VTRPELVFATAAYADMQAALCARIAAEPGQVERRVFPDGERYLRLETDPAARDVIVLGGTISEADTLELYDLASGVVEYGAARLTLVIPFFGYSTMERAVQAGEIVTAKTRARLLSSIPDAAMGNRVFLLDLHVSAVAHYFEAGIRPVHVYAKPIIAALARRLGGDDFVLACTDAGRAKWVESLASDIGVDAAFVYKRRLDAERTEVTGVSAHVRDRPVVIYDDMIRTGGSLLAAARAYRDAGASSIAAVATHGLFPGDALARLEAAGLLSHIACTDSHPRATALASYFLSVEPVTALLAERLEVLS
jgi:ribose-phosphate pyrophosphokinase